VQTQNGFVLFYAATVGGRSTIYYVLPSNDPGASQYDGSYFTDSAALNLGTGFESVWSPSAVGRLYRGINRLAPTGDPVIDFTFAGKLRGRPVSEIFFGRLNLDADLVPTGLAPLPTRTRERLISGGEAGTYLSDGVRWITGTGSAISLEVQQGAGFTDIEVAGTRQTERDTGIITFDTKLGGKAYLDPGMGTVRLSGSAPTRNSSLVLTYQPRLLRVSEGTTAGYAGPNVAFDDRLIPDLTYWRRGGDNSSVDNTDAVRNGRYLFAYGRAAAGSGQAARPMLKTMRFGVDLPAPIFTNPDGSTGAITITTGPGGVQYYQLDPAKKKIYFTSDDEDQSVNIQYEAADEATGRSIGVVQTGAMRISMISERPEELVQLDQATNETNLAMFLDPFDYLTPRRPGLVWMLWSSTRTGSPDVYMHTIAPRFTPLLTGK
jgi:hypothetical protein